jgi:hypothetical protein
LAHRLIDQSLADEIVGQPHKLIVKESRGLRRAAAAARLVVQPPGDLSAARFERAAQDRRRLWQQPLARADAVQTFGKRPAIDDRTAVFDIE